MEEEFDREKALKKKAKIDYKLHAEFINKANNIQQGNKIQTGVDAGKSSASGSSLLAFPRNKTPVDSQNVQNRNKNMIPNHYPQHFSTFRFMGSLWRHSFLLSKLNVDEFKYFSPKD